MLKDKEPERVSHPLDLPVASVAADTATPVRGTGSSPTVTSPTGSDTEVPMPYVPRRYLGVCELMGLFAVSFSYAFVFNTINNIVIPKEIERLSPSRQSVWVGMIMAAGAISQLSTPIVGAWSDRAGQRISFLIYGTFVTILGIVLFLFVSTVGSIVTLFAAHVVTTVGLSVQYSMLTALLNDFVCDEQVGKGSGTIAILAILGSGAGYSMFAANFPLHYSFCAYILSTVLCLGICVLFVPSVEASSRPIPRKASSSATRCAETVVMALSMPSPSRYPDFFFACMGRALFNAGLAGQVYLVYFLRDVMHAPNSVQITSYVAVMALVGGIVGALPAGIISDRVGKKPVIYISIFVCILSLGAFMAVQKMDFIVIIGFVYGIGNIAYLSVDYALGVQSLPKRSTSEGRRIPIDAAKDLGVFAMSSTAGQLFGQVAYGAVLDWYAVQTPTGTQYSHIGFITIYTLGAVFFLCSGLSTHFIRGVR